MVCAHDLYIHVALRFGNVYTRLMELIVDVTQEDINKGNRGSCRTCPVAVAMNRALDNAGRMPAFHFARVAASIWDLASPEGCCPRWSGQLPDRVRGFIEAFDSYHTSLPFSFWIEIPDVWPEVS